MDVCGPRVKINIQRAPPALSATAVHAGRKGGREEGKDSHRGAVLGSTVVIVKGLGGIRSI